MAGEMTGSVDLFERHPVGLHQLRRLHSGELSGAEADGARDHLSSCPLCQSRMEELTGEDRQVRAALPFDRFADGIARRTAQRPRWNRWVPAVSVALAAGVATLVALPALRSTPRNTPKGGSGLMLYVGGVGEPRRVQGDAQLQPGERVRLEYEAGDHRFLAVLSIDQGGAVTPLYPQQGQSQAVERGPGRMLPQSIDFFGAGRERLMAVFSDAPLQVSDLVTAAQQQFHKAGSLGEMGSLGLGDEEIDRTILKSGSP